MWLAIGAALLTARGSVPRVLGAVAVATGLATAPVLVVLSVALALVLLARRRRTDPTRAGAVPSVRAVPRIRPWIVTGAFGAAIAGWLALVAPSIELPQTNSDPGHAALAAWLGSATDPRTTVTVPAGTWSNLVRQGVPPERLTSDGALVVTASTSPQQIVRFGALGVGTAEDTAARPAGAQLATNPRIVAGPEVLETLSAGNVDVRAQAILAGLTRLGPVTVTDLPTLPGETTALPHHVVVLPPVTFRTDEWLRAQQPPFAPSITTTAEATTLSWPVPAPPELRR